MSRVPAISIITPVWNGLPYIKECVESVLNQEFQDWELLVGDNGSTDGTLEYLATQTDPRIHLFRNEKNLGISGNLNFLFTKAKASIAYILCADDYLFPNVLNDVVSEWNSTGDNVAFICFSTNIDRSKLWQHTYQVLPKNFSPTESGLAFFLLGNFTRNLSNVSVKVSAVNSAGGFVHHLKTATDFEMWRKLSKKNDLVISKRDVVFIREHTGSATHYMTQKGDDYGQLITVYEDLLEQLSGNFDRKKLISYFNTQITSQYLRTAIKHALSGRFTFMKTVLNARSVMLWSVWRQLLVCTPLALSNSFREYLGLRQAKNLWAKGR